MREDFFRQYYRHVADPTFRSSADLNPLEQLFYRFLNENFFFVQIGANNGRRFDPIHHLLKREGARVAGIAVEPVAEYFDELKETYRHIPSIRPILMAIHNTEREKTMFKIHPEKSGYPEYLKGMASFDKNNFLKDGIPETDLLTETVPCLPLQELLRRENVQKVHLLMIDTEGYDLEIIRSLDFEQFRPNLIHFEHRRQYGLVSDADLFAVTAKLMDAGYRVLLDGNDTLAYLEQ